MTTAAAPDIAPAPPAKSTAELFLDLCTPLFPPALVDMRRRCAEEAKAKGASERVVAGILAVPLAAPVRAGVDE